MKWRRVLIGAVIATVVLAAGGYVWREDILRTALDPKTPFQTYVPPPAPDYARREAWALLPAQPETWTMASLPADVFFVHPTTYDGGREWNAPVDEPGAERLLQEVMLPNYAGPYATVGRVFAPRYRQASLYATLTLRDDAREARRFAYDDVRGAFRLYAARYNRGRPFVLVGVEQGGSLAARLLAEEIAPDPALAKRLVVAHLIETIVPAEGAATPPCTARAQPRCVLAYAAVREGDGATAARRLGRALVWTTDGHLEELNGRDALCVNPLLGLRSEAAGPEQVHLGGANATGLEWGLRPGFMARQVSAQCRDGVLHVGQPKSPSLRPRGGWAERRRAPAYNLFYADLGADAAARLKGLDILTDFARPAPPIERSIVVRPAPVHRID